MRLTVSSRVNIDLDSDHSKQVWNALSEVSDPELDESVTDMGFVNDVNIDKHGNVQVGFRLPTFWCAPNFAFLMAQDMHDAIEALPWVNSVKIGLADHCNAEEINSGIDQGLSFSDTFKGQAIADLDDLRVSFRRKAFQGRQEVLLRCLRSLGIKDSDLCGMTMRDLRGLKLKDKASNKLHRRYIEIRGEFGGQTMDNNVAFPTVAGEPLHIGIFEDYLKELRSVRVNSEFNANLCRGILDSRYNKK